MLMLAPAVPPSALPGISFFKCGAITCDFALSFAPHPALSPQAGRGEDGGGGCAASPFSPSERGEGAGRRMRGNLQILQLRLEAQASRRSKGPGGYASQKQIILPGDPTPWR